MIIIAGTIPTRAEDRDAAVAACVTMQTATMAEPGCQVYAFSFDMEQPTIVRLFEVWLGTCDWELTKA